MTRLVTLAGYALIAAAMLAAEAAARRRQTIPTFLDAVALVARHRAGRWLLLAGWMWLGWHLFVRVHR